MGYIDPAQFPLYTTTATSSHVWVSKSITQVRSTPLASGKLGSSLHDRTPGSPSSHYVSMSIMSAVDMVLESEVADLRPLARSEEDEKLVSAYQMKLLNVPLDKNEALADKDRNFAALMDACTTLADEEHVSSVLEKQNMELRAEIYDLSDQLKERDSLIGDLNKLISHYQELLVSKDNTIISMENTLVSNHRALVAKDDSLIATGKTLVATKKALIAKDKELTDARTALAKQEDITSILKTNVDMLKRIVADQQKANTKIESFCKWPWSRTPKSTPLYSTSKTRTPLSMMELIPPHPILPLLRARLMPSIRSISTS